MKKIVVLMVVAIILGAVAGFGEVIFSGVDVGSAIRSASSSSESSDSDSSSSSSSLSESTTSSSSSSSSSDSESEEATFDDSEAISELSLDEMFTNNELTLTYDEADATTIQLSGESVTISEEGTYILSGTLTDGQIIVEVGDTDKVHLVLDGVDISCSSSAAIYIKQADKVFITLADGSYNTLSVTGEYVNTDDNDVDGVIFAKSDVSFLGTGTLEINADYGHGMVAKDDLVFMSGTYNITAASHGINANDSIRIASGDFTIVSGKDGMKADNSDEADKGYIYMADGTFDITAERDGISSSTMIQVDSGTFSILSGGGYVEVLNEITVGEGSGNMTQVTDTLEDSMKGMKACNILINGGDIYISSYEDGFHANYELTINDGIIYVLSGDDAIHADDILNINDGEVTVAESYEGIEADYINLNGGSVSVNAYDDAINGSSSSGSLTITDGDIYISCVGDGLDANGDLSIEGGYIVIDCNPIYSGGDGAVDVSGSVTYTGGTVVDADGEVIDPTSSTMGGGMNGFSQMGPFSGNSKRR